MKKLFLLLCLTGTSLASMAQTTILSEGFNVTSRTGTPPTGWTLPAASQSGSNDGGCGVYNYTWEQVPSLGFNCNGSTPTPLTHSGSGMAGYNAWDIYSGGKTELVTPALNFSGAGTTTLNVWIWDSVAYYFGSPNPQYDSLAIYVNTSPSSSGGTLLYLGTPSYNLGGAGWTLFSFSIPTTYTGTTNYIIFRGASLYGNDIFFDDVEVIRNPPAPCTGTPAAATITTAAIPAANPLCSGSTKTISATDPNFPTIGGFTYDWQSSATATGPWTTVSTTSTGASTLSYTTGSLSVSTYYRLRTTCNASGNAANSNVYLVPVGAPQPGAISGSTSFCPGDPSTYSVTNVAGTTYTWTLPSGWSGSSTTNSISVTPGSSAGSISVTASNSCGTSIPQTKAISLGSAPLPPTAITGNTSACANATQTYSTSAVAGATSYNWTLPAGWSITGTAGGGQSITVLTGTSGGNVTVTAGNGCGSNSFSLAVTVISTLASPGTISGPSSPCSGVLYNYSVTPVPGATSYQWNIPTGWSGTNTGTSVQIIPGTTSGQISVTAYSSCATSPTSTLAVSAVSTVTPSVTVSTTATQICQNAPIAFSATPVNGGTGPSYIWLKNGSPVSGTGSSYTDNSLATGDMISVMLLSNAGCRLYDTVTATPLTLNVTPLASPGVSINTTPIVTICAGSMVHFNTTTNGGGTFPTYQWFSNGIAIPTATGNNYSTAALNNNDTITVKMTTNADCPAAPFVFSNKVGIRVNEVIAPSISVSASTTTVVPGLPITFTAMQSGGGATPVYQWILNGVAVPGETGVTYTSAALKPTDHVSATMISYDPCANPNFVSSNEIVLDGGPTAITAQSNWQGTISLYPNPTAGHFTIAAAWASAHTGSRVSIDVLNVIGQTVYHSEVAPDKAQWHYDVQLGESTPDGHYTLRLQSADGMRVAMSFILNR